MEATVLDEALDVGNQLTHAAEGSASNCLLGNYAKPALDLVKPTRVGRREVQVIAGMFGQPRFDLAGTSLNDGQEVEQMMLATPLGFISFSGRYYSILRISENCSV